MSLEFRNPGGRLPQNPEVNASCGCTLVERLSNPDVPGGQRIIIPVSVKPPAIGKKTVQVTVKTDSERTPSVQVTMTISGQKPAPPLVRRSPREVELVGTIPEEWVDRIIQIETWEEAGSPPWITGIETTDELIEVSRSQVRDLESAIGGLDRTYQFNLRAQVPAAGHLSHSSVVRVMTSRQSMSAIPSILLFMRLEPPVVAIPGEMLFSLDDSSAPATRRVVVKSQDEASLNITEVETDVPWLVVLREFGASPANQSIALLKVRVLLEELKMSDTRTGAVRLRLEHSSLESLTIPVTVDVLPGNG